MVEEYKTETDWIRMRCSELHKIEIYIMCLSPQPFNSYLITEMNLMLKELVSTLF